MQITIIFGSSGGVTKEIAQKISNNLDGETELIDVANATIENFENSSILILGTSTWGEGDLQDDWEDFIDNLDNIDFSGKKVALFGVGDQDSYYDSFLNGMGTLYAKVKEKGATIIGDGVDLSDFDFEESTAIENNAFVGLAIDEDNQSDLTDNRIIEWTKKLSNSI